MSKPLHQFGKTIDRANALLDIFSEREFQIATGVPATAEYIQEDDIVRAATVIAVAAMDHYFTAKFTDVLATFLKTNEPSDELLKVLEKAGLTTKVALELATMKRPFRRVRTMVQNHLSRYTSHRAAAIDKLFSSLNLKGLCGRAEAKLKRKNLLKRLDNFVELRNEISHSAHISTRGQVKAIDVERIRGLIDDLDWFVRTCDGLIENHIKK
ncbi:hypothetical protein XMM379_001045 [Aliiroseovarius sp. xm-m-379]|uniref:HEPN domain-containing protein n=1 Tax=unclassified Aliiroseovarius TaxID=2623558 RepID=UPI0015687846|nr:MULTISPECIES: HEPN domain-containing protein [unclassified Aliiroseovarius]NRP12803.1 hypothetical protein [Aliiroseovarius sp. xm-d-517]NRP24364.1 hypothetical protein [Aliiroseovarius sp. xm-m-379]NRP29825.1 hypothetical protein [Aliiroseovarius sp. xm-m-314]NRP33163.1 hypothetical protein [Aliiroseovarius sp. xm-a-104]NRP39836.1 hypothetical protein [Aliiroseovarius sp. xm-m-339-2]